MRLPSLGFRFAAPAAGFGFGCAVALTFPDRDAPLWLVWAPFAIGTATAAGAVFAYGTERWRELQRLRTVGVRDVAWPVTVLVVGSQILSYSTVLLPGPSHASERNGLVGTLAILAAIPAAGAMYGVWRVAASDVSPTRQGETVDLLLALRRLLQQLVAATGSLVALVTFANGSWWLMERSLHAQYGNRPSQYVLIYGAFSSLLVALAYGPAWAALQRHGQQLCDQLLLLRGLDDPAAVLCRIGDRRILGQALGIDHGIFPDLQSGLVLLAPLAASAVSAFLPH